MGLQPPTRNATLAVRRDRPGTSSTGTHLGYIGPGTTPAQPLVEGPRPAQIRHAERYETEPLFHAVTAATTTTALTSHM